MDNSHCFGANFWLSLVARGKAIVVTRCWLIRAHSLPTIAVQFPTLPCDLANRVNRMTRLIVLSGLPGTGKSAIARGLAQKLGAV